jgi:hypothetical protein
VGGIAGEQCAIARVVEEASEPRRREQRMQSEARQGDGMARRSQRGEDGGQELVGVAYERLHEPPVRGVTGCLDGALEDGGVAAVERMRERHARMHELEPVLGERQPAQKRGRERQRVHRGAGVVHEARERQLFGAAAPADGPRPLEDGHPPAGPGQHDGGRETVRARPDYDGVRRGLRQPRDRA